MKTENFEKNNLNTDEDDKNNQTTDEVEIDNESITTGDSDQVTCFGRAVVPLVKTKVYIVSEFAKCNQSDGEDLQIPNETLARNDN